MLQKFSKNLFQQAESLILITGIAFLTISLFNTQDLIDIHIHDTMYVFSFRQLTGVIGIVLILEWLVYLALHKHLYRNYLAWIHVLTTFIALALILMAHYSFSGQPIVNGDSWKIIQAESTLLESMLLASLLLLIISHILFAFNILAGIINRRN